MSALAAAVSTAAIAADEASLPAIGGYDPVAYQTENHAVRGSGANVATYQGQTYLFATEENKKTFEQSPAKYVPAYGGWCAFGMSMGKKFHADPTAYAVIDGKTYFVVNNDIRKQWEADRAKLIEKADQAWPKVRTTPASKL
jgi:YHS domain-containing protein